MQKLVSHKYASYAKGFRKYLYDQWYESLSDDGKQRLAERKKKKKEQEDRELQNTLREIEMVAALCSSITNKYKV